MKAEVTESSYEEITDQMGDVPVVVFPFRLSTNRHRYVKEVIEFVGKKMESVKSFRVDLLFMRGIPESMGRVIADKVVRGISSLHVPGSEDIHVHIQGGVDADLLDELERDFPVTRL